MNAMTILLAAALELPLVPYPTEVKVIDGDPVAVKSEAAVTRDSTLAKEGYRLQVGHGGIAIAAADDAGEFYARQTLRQLRRADGTYPQVEIADAPKFSWRGLHLDSSRHFFEVAAVKKFIDTMATYKFNTLHWHLTDNEGWRLPVPGYMELTRAGRAVQNRTNFRDVATGILPVRFYTRDELKEIVEYARSRQVQIVPEVDMPGHCEAVLSIEHELGCFPPNEVRGGGPIDKVRNALCPGRDRTLEFCERVLETVTEIFPCEVVHIGGDECDRTNWKTCEKCQARMRAKGLKDVAELQAWFTGYLVDFLAKKGRRALGWDEIMEGGLPDSAMVMSWRGAKGGVTAAQAGHDVVMTPCEYCYFDYEQLIENDPVSYNFDWTVPLPLAKVYSFDPLKGIPAEFHWHVLGAQGNNWSEMTCAIDELEWKVWPRAAALAEVLWSYPAERDIERLSARLEPQLATLRQAGVNAAPVRRRPVPGVRGELKRDGTRLDYRCGATVASAEIVNGELVLTVNGKRPREFTVEKNKPFVSVEVIELGPDAYYATFYRQGSLITANVLFDGETVRGRERWDNIPESEVDRPLDLQALVDAAAAKGGGEVKVPAGRWIVKPFVLKSNITLRLDDRTEIFASDDLRDYSPVEGQRCFIFAEAATNVAIVGKGLINGRGWRFRQLKGLPGESQPQALPVMMRFSRCRQLKLEDFTYCDCGAWGCHLRNCDGVEVRRVQCFSHVNNTNDGIDIESSNVLIEDCDIDSDDDAIVFKTESDVNFPVTNVVVRNCRLGTCCNAIKFGTGSYCDFRDIRIENIVAEKARGNHHFRWYAKNPGVKENCTGISAIAVEVCDGGRMENVTIRNVEFDGYCVPLFVRHQRRREPQPGRETYLRKVLIENVKGRAASQIASSITGVDGLRPHDITLRNFDITVPGGGSAAEMTRPVPEAGDRYPDAHMFDRLPLPAYGFYVRHADRIRFENIKVTAATSDARPLFRFEDATEISGPAADATIFRASEELSLRGGIGNFIGKLRQGRPVTVVYFGGSITQGTSYRPAFTEWLRSQYPTSTITEVNAAIGGTGSNLGVYRLERDVLKHRPDLVFVEFALNDGDRSSVEPERVAANVEAIVRGIRDRDLNTDIVFLYTIKRNMAEDFGAGRLPREAAIYETVAEHYGIPSVNFGPRVMALAEAGKLVWTLGTAPTAVPKEDPDYDRKVGSEMTAKGMLVFSNDGVHPRSEGGALYVTALTNFFAAVSALTPAGADRTVALAGRPFVADPIVKPQSLELQPTLLKGDWRSVGADDARFGEFLAYTDSMWVSERPGDRLEFEFDGNELAIYALYGPAGARLECEVDGVKLPSRDLCDRYCTYWRLMRVPIFKGAEGRHRVTLTISGEQPDRECIYRYRQVPSARIASGEFNGQVAAIGRLFVCGGR